MYGYYQYQYKDIIIFFKQALYKWKELHYSINNNDL